MDHAAEADAAADCREERAELIDIMSGLARAGKARTKITWTGRDGKEVDADTCHPARLKNTIAMYARKGMTEEAEALRDVAKRRGIT